MLNRVIFAGGGTGGHIYMAVALAEELKKHNIAPWHIEGLEKMDWVLMDYVDVVVNIFNPIMREYYNVERLWSDALITDIVE